jgi:4-hydroxythreonine-4-phosphate dehydrogenase
MLPRIGLLLGDPNGIGPELVARLLAAGVDQQRYQLVVIGDRRVYQEFGEKVVVSDNELPFARNIEKIGMDGPPVLLDVPNVNLTKLKPGQVSAYAGKATLETLGVAVDLARERKLDGLCFAPLNKESLSLGGNVHGDDMRLFADLLGCTGSFGEVNVLDNLWTSLVTSHVALAKVAAGITEETVSSSIELMHATLVRTGHTRPRIAVAALNPHAGEGGLFGFEEIEIIRPAIETVRSQGVNVDGPWPADTVFLRARSKAYDAVVTMYHDQGQIAMKLLGFDRGVTILAGLPIPITTPAHGTAFDIVGDGVAKVEAITKALQLVGQMVGTHPRAGL